MKKFQLDERWVYRIDDLSDLAKFHREIQRKVVNLRLRVDTRCDFYDFFLSNWNETEFGRLTSIEIEGSYVHVLGLVQILTSAENLTTLFLNGSILFGDIRLFDAFQKPRLKKLSTLKIHKMVPSLYFLDLLTLSQIRTFEVHLEKLEVVPDLMNFLTSQTKLDYLKIRLGNDAIFQQLLDLSSVKPQPAYRLRKLSLSYAEKLHNSTLFDESLVKFLRPHQISLQELELQVKLGSNILQFILTKLVSLKTLSLEAAALPNDEYFYKQLQPSSEITKLTVHDDFGTNESRQLLKLFSNLESLSIGTKSQDVLKLVEKNLCRLKSLEIESFPASNDLNIKFPLLREFHVRNVGTVDNVDSWCKFLASNPTIERVYIDDFHDDSILDEKIISAMTHAANVRYIRVHGFDHLDKFFELFQKVGFTRLENLEVVSGLYVYTDQYNSEMMYRQYRQFRQFYNLSTHKVLGNPF